MNTKDFKIFICCNKFQKLGALVSKYSFEKIENNIKSSQIEIIEVEKFNEFKNFFSKPIKDTDNFRIVTEEDLQSFTLLRFIPPQIQNYNGYSLVIDPDVFCVKKGVFDLIQKLDKKFTIAAKKDITGWASSVMFLNNKKLKHWNINKIIENLVNHKSDYRKLMSLDKEKVLEIDECFNHYDTIKKNTILLHTTNRITQPWRAGLKFNSFKKTPKPFLKVIPRKWIWKLIGKNTWDFHVEHPDNNVSKFFFSILAEMINKDKKYRKEAEKSIEMGLVRKDLIDICNKY